MTGRMTDSPPQEGPPPQEGLELGSASLRDYFAARLPARLREVEEAWEQVLASGWQPDDTRTFHRLAHSLAGAGATFGFPAVTEAARLLEQLLKPVVQGASPPPDDDTVAALLAGLHRASRLPAGAETSSTGSGKSVLLVASDPELGPWIAQQLERFGYRVRLLEQPDRLAEEIEREPPCALLLDQMFQGGRLVGGAQELARLGRSLQSPMRTVFLSDHGDLESRLAAVRAGGEAYFTKPLDIAALVDQLDVLTGPPAEAYRALVVEADDELAGECAGALRAAGLQVSVETDPERFLEALATSRPDVVLMGLELPGCSGAELAEVLHQIEGYVGTPVLFLVPGGNGEDRLTALELGGDELFTRPIDPRHLIGSVTSRARRGRRLTSLISYDSLTSVLNHASLKQQLDAELARAARERVSVAFAMLDLDRFKAINDAHGHAAGDRLLRTLALFLKQRLRRSDIVGRYGGDEIGIIFPNTDGPTARTVLDNLRESFSRLFQSSAGTELSATFSGGIAVFPDFPTAELLVEGAERALSTAKSEGRNRIALQ